VLPGGGIGVGRKSTQAVTGVQLRVWTNDARALSSR
jgi:hypothetical protein